MANRRAWFALRERGSTVGREARGALTTFLTMAYILVANPAILVAAGIPKSSAVACTALAAALSSILMGVLADFPIALAAGMGLNAVIAFQVTPVAGTWQRAMGLVVLDGLLVLVLVLMGLREAVMAAIPKDLRLAIGAGIGVFIAFIGLQHAHLVAASSVTLVSPGSLRDPVAYTALVGIIVTALLMARRVKGSLLIGILFTTVLWYLLKPLHLPGSAGLAGFAMPEFTRPDFGIALQADVPWALANLVRRDTAGHLYLYLLPVLLSVVMVDFFDTLGTVTAIAEEGRIIDEKTGEVPGLRRILIADSIAASIGGMLGASSATSYIESAAGVAEGARTGLHSVFVGLLFLAAIFAAPVAMLVPDAATAPALVLVGFLMIGLMAKIDYEHLDTAIPAFLTLLLIPLTFSIAHGIGYGFIAFVLIKVLSLRVRDVHPLMYFIAAAFAAYFLFAVA